MNGGTVSSRDGIRRSHGHQFLLLVLIVGGQLTAIWIARGEHALWSVTLPPGTQAANSANTARFHVLICSASSP